MWWFFFFNDTATTEIYTLSLHDALPIWRGVGQHREHVGLGVPERVPVVARPGEPLGRDRLALAAQAGLDRKSTRLNSSHANISYAVFCLKKKKKYKHYVQLSQANSPKLC